MKNQTLLLLSLISALLPFSPSPMSAAEKSYEFQPSTNDVVYEDFEGVNWGKWSAAGTAFGLAPARGQLPNQGPLTGFQGSGLASSFVGGDASRGRLVSLPFTLKRPYISFLISGGNFPGKVCINLIIDGKTAYSATGAESERMLWHSWQLFPVLGRTAHLEILDDQEAKWGHINIDQIRFTEHPLVPPYFNDAITRGMTSTALAVERAEADPARPGFHFTAPANWMNDPNGPIYHERYYHIYYQYNPFGDKWGHMHWGHARSRDLVNWKQMPIALWPSTELGEEHVFSGCTTTNSLGTVVALYTSIQRGRSASDHAEQWMAVGDGDGNTFVKHTNNPVLAESIHTAGKVYDWRDPFVFRDHGVVYLVCGGNLNQAKGGKAVVTLYEATQGDLTQWKYRGVLFQHPDPAIKNIECPNFFKLGDRWVLLLSPHGKVQYFTGTFDAAAGKFTPSQQGLMDHSEDYYAPNGMEDPSSRRILWGWVRGFPEDKGWNGCLTLPRLLSLSPEGHILQAPAPELSKLRGPQLTLSSAEIRDTTNYVEGFQSDSFEINLELELLDATSAGLQLRCSADGTKSVLLAVGRGELSVGDQRVQLPADPGTNPKVTQLRVFADRSVFEVYANGGRTCVTRVLSPGVADRGLALFAAGGAMKVRSLDVWPLRSIW